MPLDPFLASLPAAAGIAPPIRPQAPMDMAAQLAMLTPSTLPPAVLGDDEMGPQAPGKYATPKGQKVLDGVTAQPEGRGFLNGPMTPEREQMIMELLAAATQSASQSTSPLANFLAPIAAALIQNNIATRSDQAASQAQQDMMSAVLGPGVASDPRAQQLLGMVSNDSAPAFLRERAQQQLEALIAAGVPAPAAAAVTGATAPGGSGGGRRPSSGGSTRRYSSGGGGVSRTSTPSSTRTQERTDRDSRTSRRGEADDGPGLFERWSDRLSGVRERVNANIGSVPANDVTGLDRLVNGLVGLVGTGAPRPQVNDDPLNLRS